MKRAKSFLFALLTLTSSSTLVFGQSNGDPAGAACGILGCGAFGLFYLLILAVCLAVPITIDVLIIKWIRKDALAKGMPNADTIKWLGLLNWLGLVIYLLQRPQTMVLACSKCGNPLMPGQTTCPRCGNA